MMGPLQAVFGHMPVEKPIGKIDSCPNRWVYFVSFFPRILTNINKMLFQS